MNKTFWTDKRLEALSRTSLTLFQGFVIAVAIGGIFDKITEAWVKILFVIITMAFFIVGIIFADSVARKETT